MRRRLQSSDLNTLLFQALDYAVENLRDCGRPLVPFLLYRDENGTRLERGVAETLEEGLENCRAVVRDLPSSVTCYVVVYDGYITIPGQAKCDAIIAEGAERGSTGGLRLAQRYRPRSGLFSRFSVVGNPVLLGEAENLLGG